MKKNKIRLTLVQQRMIYYLQEQNIYIRAGRAKTKTGGYEWFYNFIVPAARDIYFSLNSGAQVQNVYNLQGLGIWSSRTIECLIRKKVLVCEMMDKEFNIQLALGTVDSKVYELAEEYK